MIPPQDTAATISDAGSAPWEIKPLKNGQNILDRQRKREKSEEQQKEHQGDGREKTVLHLREDISGQPVGEPMLGQTDSS